MKQGEPMRKICVAAAVLLTSAAPCAAQGIIGRVGSAVSAGSNAESGTVVLVSPQSSGDELVLVLDNQVEHRLGCFAIERSDIGRVAVGSTLVAYGYSGSVVHLGDLECRGVNGFRIKDQNKKEHRDFLSTHYLLPVAYALRDRPVAASKLLTRAQMAPLAAELDTLREMLVISGALEPLQGPQVCVTAEQLQAEQVETQVATDRAERLQAAVTECEVALQVGRTYLEASGSEVAVEGVRSIDSYFREH